VKKVLVLGCSHAEVPLVQALQQRGAYVGAVGADPDGLALARADAAHITDYSNHQSVRSIVDDYQYQSVVAGCNDFSAFTRAQLGLSVGENSLDSVSQTELVHHKDKFRELCVSKNIPTPRAAILTDSDLTGSRLQQLRFPVIVKPTDLTGGKGMSVCSSQSEIEEAVIVARRRSRRSSIVIEEFIEGQLRSASYWLMEGVPHLITHADEFMYLNPYLVSAAIAPSEATTKMLNGVRAAIETLCRAVGLHEGLVHVQYIASGTSFSILEICRRPPGDLYVMLPTLFSDRLISDLIADQALGLRIDLGAQATEIPPTLRFCVMAPRNGEIESWQLSELFSRITEDMVPLLPKQAVISDFLTQKLGIAFASSPDRDTLVHFVTSPDDAVEIRYLT
jgi:formate-dependent phosphoribosylglycinamide formyltransferase (GAR transformylase)